MLKYLIFISFHFIYLIGKTQDSDKINIKFDAKISSVEEVGAKLNVVKIIIVRDNIKVDSTIAQNGRCKISLDTGYVYKIYFNKSGYVSKHLLISTKDLPNSYPKKSTIKVDVSLFKTKSNLDMSFLNTKPIGIATYNFVSKKIQWDAEYTRLIIEKIIEATVIEYDKTKSKDE